MSGPPPCAVGSQGQAMSRCACRLLPPRAVCPRRLPHCESQRRMNFLSSRSYILGSSLVSAVLRLFLARRGTRNCVSLARAARLARREELLLVLRLLDISSDLMLLAARLVFATPCSTPYRCSVTATKTEHTVLPSLQST